LLFRLDLLGALRSKSGAGLFPDHALVLRRNRPLEQETMEERRKFPRTEIKRTRLCVVGWFGHDVRGVQYFAGGRRPSTFENPASFPRVFRLVMAKDSFGPRMRGCLDSEEPDRIDVRCSAEPERG